MKKSLLLVSLSSLVLTAACSSLSSSLPQRAYIPTLVSTDVVVPEKESYVIKSDDEGAIYLTLKVAPGSQVTLKNFRIARTDDKCELSLNKPLVLTSGANTIRAFDRDQLSGCVPDLRGYSEVNTLKSASGSFRSVAAAAVIEWSEGNIDNSSAKATPFIFYDR